MIESAFGLGHGDRTTGKKGDPSSCIEIHPAKDATWGLLILVGNKEAGFFQANAAYTISHNMSVY